MQVVPWAAFMRKVVGNVWHWGTVVSCRSVLLGQFPGMSQNCSPAVCGGVHRLSLSQGPGGSWILLRVSPWWKSQSILLVLSERACAISVIEREQHPQAAIVSALACSADCTWPRLWVLLCGLGELQCITSCYICLSGRWKRFICRVFPVDLWEGLILRGNLCILGGLESRAATMVCWLPCFPVFWAGGVSGRIKCLCWLKRVGIKVALSACSVWPQGASKTSKETASQRLWVHRNTSLVYILCLCLLCLQWLFF